MGKQKKVWSVEVKEQAVLRFLSGEAPGKLAKEYGFAESLLYKWRATFLEGGQQGLNGKATSPSADIIRESINALPETTDPIVAALLSKGLIDLPGATMTAAEAEVTYQRYLKKLGDRKLDLTEALLEQRQGREKMA